MRTVCSLSARSLTTPPTSEADAQNTYDEKDECDEDAAYNDADELSNAQI